MTHDNAVRLIAISVFGPVAAVCMTTVAGDTAALVIVLVGAIVGFGGLVFIGVAR